MGITDIGYPSWTKYSPKEIADWYRRLAYKIEEKVGKGNSLSSELLLYWLNPDITKEDPYKIKSSYVKDMPQVKQYLLDEVRPVFLSLKDAYLDEGYVRGGIQPRIERTGRFKKGKEEPERDENGYYLMFYESKKFIEPVNYDRFKEIANKTNLTDSEKRELDIFTSLHAFALQTWVSVSVTSKPQKVQVNKQNSVNCNELLIEFKSWETGVKDEYDWNRKRDALIARGLVVPNPDYQSKEKYAISSEKQFVVVIHKDAAWRVEDAGLARPFNIRSDKWIVRDNDITAPYTKKFESHN